MSGAESFMPDTNAPDVMWRLRNPWSGKTVCCTLAQQSGRFVVYVDDGTSTPAEFDGAVAAIHHAIALASDLRARGWTDA